MQFSRGEFQSGLFPCSSSSPPPPPRRCRIHPHSPSLRRGPLPPPSSPVQSLRAMPPTDIYIIGPDTSADGPGRDRAEPVELVAVGPWRAVWRERDRLEGGREVGRPMCNISPPPSIHGATMPDQIEDPSPVTSLNRGVGGTTPSGNCHLYAGISFVVPLRPLSPLSPRRVLKLVLPA